ncbi:membrane protein [Streptomyces sp. 6-11-2]|nr:membrane protein [Streptomyces sp. 6-11-2]
MATPQLTRMHRVLIGVVVTGAVIIAGIGFAGSYAAVRELAIKKGFGNFSYVFPIGIDAGICVLLALDLLLTWIRIPFPLLRQTAWLLTLATIAFNGAAAWPDPLGVGMHAVIPVLFVVAVEAARHAIGRIADITADKHMEGVRLTRWLLSPVPTFLLWRRMKLWELRSYDQVIKLEQERLVYQARLRSRFGRAWRRKAPVESLMPLRLARYGVPLGETAPAGLAAAGIEPALIPPRPQVEAAADARAAEAPRMGDGGAAQSVPALAEAPPGGQRPELAGPHNGGQQAPDEASPWFSAPQQVDYHGGYDPAYEPEPPYEELPYEEWYEEHQGYQEDQGYQEHQGEAPQPQQPEPSPEDTGSFPIPAGPNRTRQLGEGGGTPPAEPDEEAYYQVFRQSINGSLPTPREFADGVEATYGISLPDNEAKHLVSRFSNRFNAELEEDHIA